MGVLIETEAHREPQAQKALWLPCSVVGPSCKVTPWAEQTPSVPGT